MLHDCHIISSFKNVRYSAELEVSKEISFNLLESMILLFTRVRSFSYSRDVREKHRNAKKQANKSSLRTEIKKIQQQQTIWTLILPSPAKGLKLSKRLFL